jgi:tRNA(fMet)-specific endonuclease VapC
MHGSFLSTRRFLLDTNVVIAIQKQDRSMTRRITPEMELYLPSIALGELFLGAHRSRRVHQNLLEAKLLARTYTVVPCNTGTAEAYGSLHAYLLNKGRPIPDNDIWIAAIAHQRGFTLITRDTHFQYIDFLSLLIW